MKTKKRLLMFCGLVCTLVLSISLCMGVMFAGTSPELTLATELEQSYELGTELEIPTGTITVGENTATAEAVLVFPSGAAYKAATSIVLTEEGLYKMQYRATIEGKLYVVEKLFVAQNSLYGHSSGSKVEYGTYDAASHNPKGLTPTGGSVTGLMVNLAGGDTLRYNKVIDLNTLTKDDQIIKFAITPNEIGTADTQEMFMYLTDAYDPENVITIKIRQPDPVTGYSNIYMSAAAPKQQLAGWEWNSGRRHDGGNYGYPFRANFSGFFPHNPNGDPSPYLSTIPENTVSFSMNYAERELHSTIRPASESSTVVCDFDNSRDFGVLWEGFTTGEVFVSVMSASPANFVITEIAGRSDISDQEFGERVKPSISVDFGDYEESDLPFAVVGSPYPLFAAEGNSPYAGKLQVASRVYGNYYANNRYELLVENGVFTPTQPGTYFIAYEARDNFGQLGTKVVTIEAKAAADVEEMEIFVEDNDTVGVAGHAVSVGSLRTEKSVGTSNIVATYTVGEDAAVVIEDGAFVPTKAGTYTVKVTATDYISRVKTAQYTVEVAAGTTPVFASEPMLPVAFVSGSEYILPEVKANNYTDGSGDEVPVVIKAIGATSETTVRGGKYTPFANENGEVITIKYSATIESGTEVWEQEVPVVIPTDEEGKLHFERFLIKQGEGIGSIVPGDDYTTISYNDDESFVTWANSLLANGFSVEFGAADNANTFGAITFMLVDSLNADQVITVTYTRAAAGSTVILNYDSSDVRTAGQSLANPENTLLLSYNAEGGSIKFDPFSNETFVIKNYINGEEFAGFDSGKVYVAMKMEGVQSSAKFNLVSLQTQKINNASRDRIGPKIAMTGTYGGTVDKGAVVALNPAMAADVIDPNAKCLVTVRNPDNSYAVSVSGVLLKDAPGEEAYEIVISQNGRYRVTYTATDCNGAKALQFNYVINVPDTEKPVITVDKAVATTGKVGKAIEVPSFSVSDNISVGEEIVSGVMVVTSNGNWMMLDLSKNRGFTPNRAGKYVVRYFAYDAEGNFNVLDYVINVTD